jgi:hypothetical protein
VLLFDSAILSLDLLLQGLDCKLQRLFLLPLNLTYLQARRELIDITKLILRPKGVAQRITLMNAHELALLEDEVCLLSRTLRRHLRYH